MIYIDLSTLEPLMPEKWVKNAQDLLDELKLVPDTEKATYVNGKQSKWGRFKPLLRQHSYGKCWYCETKQVRSHMDVDHFRPKGSVHECSDHLGYWWLAFDWQNYRLSCILCNRPHKDENEQKLGKHDHFPLADGSNWCRNIGDDLSLEDFLLLDPTIKEDSDLLEFLPTGVVKPRNGDQSSHQHLRAKVSINIYDLKSPELNDARGKLYKDIQDLVNDLNGYYELLESEDNSLVAKSTAFVENKIEQTLQKIRSSVQPDAEYAAVAREVIASINPKWLEEMLDTSVS